MTEREMCMPHPGDLQGLYSLKDNKALQLVRVLHRIWRVNLPLVMEVPPGGFFVMQIIQRYKAEHPDQEGIYVSQIAQKAKMAASQVSRMLRGLEERNLVGRIVDEKDRRNTYVFLTESGENICKRQREQMNGFLQRVTEGLGEEKMDTLIRLCDEMADVMEQELEKERRKRNG